GATRGWPDRFHFERRPGAPRQREPGVRDAGKGLGLLILVSSSRLTGGARHPKSSQPDGRMAALRSGQVPGGGRKVRAPRRYGAGRAFRAAARVGRARRSATNVPDEWPSPSMGLSRGRDRTRLTDRLAILLAGTYAEHRSPTFNPSNGTTTTCCVYRIRLAKI